MTDTLPSSAAEAVAAPRDPDAPRRCFICLTDKTPSEPLASWVDPCPCTLEAHQDCMLSWVVDCERSGKPLKCPVCKSTINVEGQWDPVVAFADTVRARFTRTSPWVLGAAVTMETWTSLQMYGVLALQTFAGTDAMKQFVVGQATHANPSPGDYFWGSVSLTGVAPALIAGHLLPGLSSQIFMPIASAFGMYHAVRDEHFFSWPPSPQLVMVVFPYIRSSYYNLWREFVFPTELRLNRQIMGLPAVDPRRNDGANNRRNEGGLGDGGVVGLLQNMLDALDQDEENGDGNGDGIRLVQEEINIGGEGEVNGEMVLEVVIEEVDDEEDGEQEAAHQDEAQPDRPAEVNFDQGAANPQIPENAPDEQQGPANAPEQQDGHEAPLPPPQRAGLGTILSNFSNSVVNALILPGISFAAGEALRLFVLPSSWTTPRGLRPGLLQHQWGRSLVGGCVYVVLKDAVRVYAKSRKVAAMGNRRVKNVDGRRKKRLG